MITYIHHFHTEKILLESSLPGLETIRLDQALTLPKDSTVYVVVAMLTCIEEEVSNHVYVLSKEDYEEWKKEKPEEETAEEEQEAAE